MFKGSGKKAWPLCVRRKHVLEEIPARVGFGRNFHEQARTSWSDVRRGCRNLVGRSQCRSVWSVRFSGLLGYEQSGGTACRRSTRPLPVGQSKGRCPSPNTQFQRHGYHSSTTQATILDQPGVSPTTINQRTRMTGERKVAIITGGGKHPKVAIQVVLS